ncbi:hypothetical protein IX324_003024 [Bacteroides pyogenes]|nr:hypothetical protein [Bacteroides pyogenes]
MVFAGVFVYYRLRFRLNFNTVIFTRFGTLVLQAPVNYGVFRKRQQISHIYTNKIEREHKGVQIYGRLTLNLSITEAAQSFYRQVTHRRICFGATVYFSICFIYFYPIILSVSNHCFYAFKILCDGVTL